MNSVGRKPIHPGNFEFHIARRPVRDILPLGITPCDLMKDIADQAGASALHREDRHEIRLVQSDVEVPIEGLPLSVNISDVE